MKVGILGYGVVGRGVKQICDEKNIEVSKVLVKKGEATESFMSDDIDEVIKCSDIIIECIGGLDVPYIFICKALNNKKHVVSSNKKVIATYFEEFSALAIKNNVKLCYEACVGGGIPIIHIINHIKKVDDIFEINGIMNGTTNFILDSMSKNNLEFSEALKKAQQLGYAESNPSDDIGGWDVKYKICLLANTVWNTSVDLSKVLTLGIENISKKDIAYAKSNGKEIKLIGTCSKEKDEIIVKVCPKFIDKDDYLSSVDKNINCINVLSKNLGKSSYIAQGAGSLPTAFSVVEDIINLESGIKINKIENSSDYICNLYVRSENIEEYEKYILNRIDGDSFISKKMNISNVKKIFKKSDFIAEIEI